MHNFVTYQKEGRLLKMVDIFGSPFSGYKIPILSILKYIFTFYLVVNKFLIFNTFVCTGCLKMTNFWIPQFILRKNILRAENAFYEVTGKFAFFDLKLMLTLWVDSGNNKTSSYGYRLEKSYNTWEDLNCYYSVKVHFRFLLIKISRNRSGLSTCNMCTFYTYSK